MGTSQASVLYQIGAPSSPACARPIRDIADDRIVDVVPGFTDEYCQRGEPRRETNHVHEKNGEQNSEGSVSKGESKIPNSVCQLGERGKM